MTAALLVLAIVALLLALDLLRMERKRKRAIAEFEVPAGERRLP